MNIPLPGTKIRKRRAPRGDIPSEGDCPGCGKPVRGTQKRPSWVRSDGTWHMDCVVKYEKNRRKQQQNPSP